MPESQSDLVVRSALAVSLIAVALLAHDAMAQQVPAAGFGDLAWRMVGPMRGGRTRAVAGVPAQPSAFYIGAVNGGVWKTEDAGRTWQPLFDAQPTQSIGAIAVAPSDPNTVYVASGVGLLRPDLSVGNGIYRSRDGGRSWSHLGLTEGQQIPELAVDPRDPARLFAAVLGRPYGPSPERGIYRSLDAGVTWARVLYKDADTGGSAVAIDPAHPEVVYAGLWQARLGPWEDKNKFRGTGGGLFKSATAATPGGASPRGCRRTCRRSTSRSRRRRRSACTWRSGLPRPRSIPPRRDSGYFAPTMPVRAGRASPAIRAPR